MFTLREKPKIYDFTAAAKTFKKKIFDFTIPKKIEYSS
jgi:hypothetical protein